MISTKTINPNLFADQSKTALNNMKTKHTIKAVEHLSLNNSFGTIREEGGVELEITVGFKDKDYGYFEFYDTKTNGQNWYAEGGLWIEGKTIKDYDGVSSLPVSIIDFLKEKGFDTNEIE